MKKLLYFALLIVGLFTAVGCNQKIEQPQIPTEFVGQWKLTKINEDPAKDIVVYVDFLSNGSFNIYQKVFTNGYQKLTGTIKVVNPGVTFTYENGEVSEYISYNFPSNDELVLMKANGEENSYKKTTIPAEVIELAIPTKALNCDQNPFL